MASAPLGSQYRTTLYGGTDLSSSMTADYQFQLGSLVFGAGTSYYVLNPQGIFGRPVRSQEALRPMDTGAFTLPEYPAARQIVFSIMVKGTESTLRTLVDAFQTAWRSADNGDQPLLVRFPTNTTQRFFGRPRRLEMDLKMWRQGVASITAEFYCADPRLYANTISTATLSLASAGINGVKFNSATNNGVTNWAGGAAGKFTVTFGSAPTSTTTTVTTAGTTEAPWIAKVTGPISNFRVTIGTDVLKFSGSIASSDYVVIDSMNRTILLYTAATGEWSSWYSHLQPTSSWAPLASTGSTTVGLSDDGGRPGSGSPTAGTMTINFRSAWL